MKKVIFIILLLICIKVNAVENIEINNENIIPKYNKKIKKYNFFTNKNIVRIVVSPSENETISGDGVHYLEDGDNKIYIISSNGSNYEINIYKNYIKDEESIYLKTLKISGYDINYDKNIYDYYITINDEKYLDIDYELSNDKAYLCIEGNGNFNRSNNLIRINVNNDIEYRIHVYKTIPVSKIEDKTIKELSDEKKEIVVLIIVTISCILVFLFYYISFK